MSKYMLKPLQVFVFLSFFLLLGVKTEAKETSFALDEFSASVVQAVVEKAMLQDYDGAIKELRALEPSVACVLHGMILTSRFDDLGDTLDIQKAILQLNQCKAKKEWKALGQLQLGFALVQNGNSIKGALSTREAAQFFKDKESTDAKAFYAIYGYYLDQSLRHIPFVSDKRKKYIDDLKWGAENSKYFSYVFTSPLVWIYYDREEYEQALHLIEKVLKKFPRNRVFLQNKADMLYKLKRFDEAIQVYLFSVQEYYYDAPFSIRYWCAVANLVKIYRDKGDLEKSAHWREKLDDKAFIALKKWLDPSILSDL
jgi:tetratricopeptide (TPR) repeat protein